jgi:hypothetical protein
MSGETLVFLLIWFVIWGALDMGALVGAIASARGRDGPSWFILGDLFAVFALIYLLSTSGTSPGSLYHGRHGAGTALGCGHRL